MTERNNHVPEWLVERLAAGELPAHEAARVRAALAAAGQESRIDDLLRANQAILNEHPPERVTAEVRRRIAMSETQRASERRSNFRFTVPLVATAAAAVCAAILLPFEPNSLDPDVVMQRTVDPAVLYPHAKEYRGGETQPESVRLKGLQPQLAIYKKTSEGAAPLRDGSSVSPGDIVQVAYVAAGYHYGVVLSVDSNRAVTLHLPDAAGLAVTLKPQGETALGHAFELDATAGRERFVFVTSKHPFTTDTVIDALRAGETLPPDFVTTELSLQKSTP